MHHAAMANKKEMMFELAGLGCDWRARADGIDGATAAFVLCGQHGKTTRQQVLFLCPASLAQHLVFLSGSCCSMSRFCQAHGFQPALDLIHRIYSSAF